MVKIKQLQIMASIFSQKKTQLHPYPSVTRQAPCSEKASSHIASDLTRKTRSQKAETSRYLTSQNSQSNGIHNSSSMQALDSLKHFQEEQQERPTFPEEDNLYRDQNRQRQKLVTSGKVKRATTRSTKQDKKLILETSKDPSRVLAHSKVNFNRLSDDEMTKRYMNRFKELQSLRVAFDKVVKESKKQKVDPVKLLVPPSQGVHRIARNLIKERNYQISDCQQVLDNLVQSLVDGTLSPESEEFMLIYTIVNKVMKASGRPGPSLVNSRFHSLLRRASKEQIIDFVSKKDTKLSPSQTTQKKSLLEPRLSSQLQSQFLAYSYDVAKPFQMVYSMKPDQNVEFIPVRRTQTVGGFITPLDVPNFYDQEILREKEQQVTRLSERALKKFDEENGAPLLFGTQGAK